MKKITPILIKTKDHSHSLFLPSLNESYHSRFGAINESLHVFIKNGYNQTDRNPLHIFEVGFGTGLNVLLTFLASSQDRRTVFYTTIDLYPLDPSIYSLLNYAEILHVKPETFLNIHTIPWDQDHKLSNNFTIRKIYSNFLQYHFTGQFDLIYFDAFGPDKQPDMWTESRLQAISDALIPGGLFVTYSAKGTVRRSLIKVGCRVSRIPGPPGKREMIRAVKIF